MTEYISVYVAMASFPEVQARAQAELDAVVGPGPDRLPSFDDMPDLPYYISAILNACLPWRPVSPIIISHASIKEDVFRGYRIPAGSAIVSNAWYVTERYPP